MDFSLKHLAATTLMLASLSSFTTAAHANITPQQGAAILKTFSDASITDFRQFLTSLAKSDLAKTDDLGTAISAFLDNKSLSADQQNEIHRLLGLAREVSPSVQTAAVTRELDGQRWLGVYSGGEFFPIGLEP